MKASKRYLNLNGTVVLEDYVVLSSIRLSDYNTVYAATRYMASGSGNLSEDHQGAVYSGHGLIRTSVSINDPLTRLERASSPELIYTPPIHLHSALLSSRAGGPGVMATFSDLPTEMKAAVFAYIRPNRYRRAVCLVSREFRDVMGPLLWKTLRLRAATTLPGDLASLLSADNGVIAHVRFIDIDTEM